MDEQPTQPPSESRTAIWFNKRELMRIDIPVKHAVASHNDGWRIDFGAGGRIRTVGAQGHNQNVDVEQGDFLLSSGEDFYLSLAAAPADEEKEARSKAKQDKREGGEKPVETGKPDEKPGKGRD